MANRTIQILGQGYGSSPAEITVTSNGNTVFSGTVNTADQPLPPLPNPGLNLTNVLCSFEIDMAFTGQIPMTCTVSSGTLIFSEILANYRQILNPVYTPEQLDILKNPATTKPELIAVRESVANPPLSQQDIDDLLNPAVSDEQKTAICLAHNCTTFISSGADGYGFLDNTDARSSVTIDGIPQTPDRNGLEGTWWWRVNNGSILGYNLEVPSAGTP